MHRLVPSFSRTTPSRYFTKNHQWIQLTTNDRARLGITGFYSDCLGELININIEDVELDSKFLKGAEVCDLESVKKVTNLKSPVNCQLKKINQIITDEVGVKFASRDPENKGWICEVKLDDVSEIEQLMCQEKYDEYLKKCVQDVESRTPV